MDQVIAQSQNTTIHPQIIVSVLNHTSLTKVRLLLLIKIIPIKITGKKRETRFTIDIKKIAVMDIVITDLSTLV